MALADPQAAGPQAAAGTPGPEPRPAKPGYDEILASDPAAKKLIARVTDRINFQTRESARWALERQIFETVAFFMGIQWLDYSEAQKRYVKWNAPAWSPTPVSNAMKSRVLKMVAVLLRSQPQGRVRAKTNEPADRDAARVAEALVSHAYDVCNEDELRDYAAVIAALGGTAIAEDSFNPRAGRILRVPRMSLQDTPAMELVAQCPACAAQAGPEKVGLPCPACGQGPLAEGQRPRMLPDGAPAMTTASVPEMDPETGEPIIDEIPEGELESRVLQIFNFYWDPKATKLGDARWCGEVQYVDLDWIDQNFPEMGPYVSHESGVDGANFYEASMLALVGPSIQGTAHYGGVQAYTHGAALRRYQEKPSAEYPKGLTLIVANNVLLFKGESLPILDENGNPTGDFSYTEFRYDILPGRFPGATPAADMVSLNRRINGLDAQLILNNKTVANPWILAPKGSGLDPARTQMRPGAVIPYNFVGVGTSPQVVQGQPLPQQIIDQRKMAYEAMNELAEDAIAEVARPPEGLRSGIALNFSREEMEEFKMPRRKRWARWATDRDRKRLLLMQTFYKEARAIKINGRGSDYLVKYWKGADLRGNTDIAIDPGSLQPRSVSLRNQTIFDMIEAGLLNVMDPMQRDQILETLGFSADFQTEVGPNRRRAQKENGEMDDGGQPMVHPWDNHPIHYLEHMSHIQDPAFDYLPPEVQSFELQHAMQHKQFEMLAAMQAGAPSGGPQNGAGSPADGANGAGPGAGQGAPLEAPQNGAQAPQ